MTIRAGVRVGDRYELVGRIAVGGMGEVWRGRDTTLERNVAVKVLRSEFTGDQTFLTRFRAEARNTAMLSHPNIAQVYDYGEAMADGEHVAYLVMELIDGEPLSAVLSNGKRLAPPRVLDILGQTAAGLAVAHRAQVVHRDVKPANLIVRPDRLVKITDFGISRAADHVPLTGTGMVIGTAQYLSPEQAMGRDVTPASDVYSLGVVGYEALAGRRPFDGESSVAVALAHVNHVPAPLPADVPAPIRDLIVRAMAKDPRHRFADGAAFASAVRAVARGRPIPSATHGAGTASAVPGGGALAHGSARPPTAGATRPRGGKPPTARFPAVAPVRTAYPNPQPVGYRPYPPPAPPAPPRRTGQWVTVVVLLVLLIAAGVIAYRVSQDANAGTENSAGSSSTAGGTDTGQAPADGSTQEPTTESAAPETVLVDASSYLGRPFGDVKSELEAMGLVVVSEEVDVDADTLTDLGIADQAFDKNDVITTDPSGDVEVGSEVTVFFAKKKYEPDDDSDSDGDEG